MWVNEHVSPTLVEIYQKQVWACLWPSSEPGVVYLSDLLCGLCLLQGSPMAAEVGLRLMIGTLQGPPLGTPSFQLEEGVLLPV